ncbi:kinase-like protein [Fomitiporia mediterranea MF3/22]|uniref:kinase-like protein n=1 Tax=Fomitiporia mediterranea (strain MF3/22) TaxID=694068 RepID=UPI000440825E|nr:kinase-like protein [Fomitiporia mediterranea MF3/22]EJD06441.1 kinase-like protein [Fomitiporia mediterranea MF3/22]
MSFFGRRQRGKTSKTPKTSRGKPTYVEIEDGTMHRARRTARPKTNESADTWTTTSRTTSTSQTRKHETARKQRSSRAANPSTNPEKQSNQRPKITNETKIGEGAFGEVWRANHSVYGIVAIKRMVVSDNEIRKMAEKELQLSREVSGHINIIKLRDGFSRTIDSVSNVILIFQFAPGGDLEGRIKRRTLYEADRIIVIKGSLNGLRHMHSLELVHGDIKPSNILLMGYENEDVIGSDVKLSDFGMTSRISKDRYAVSVSRLGGAVSYIAPEAWESNLTYGLDVWALGVTLYEMFNGLDSFPVTMPK